MIREPVVAGQFYPGDKDSLIKMIEGFMEKNKPALAMKAAVVPHAGYIYSGAVAAGIYSLFPGEIETAVILGPNHTGLGKEYSIVKSGSWRTPLGEVKIDEEFAAHISRDVEILKEDVDAHRLEHSIEVQLPFLQYVKPDIKIVPIVLGSHNWNNLKLIADSIALAVREKSRKIILIASSDLTHYEKASTAKDKDNRAIQAMLALDDERLIEEVDRYDISMCGLAPCYVAVNYAKKLGSQKGKLIKYQNSGDVSGDYSSVVGYAAIALV